jgi:(p)ppGpp synthase/HD superfamily hydrolase
MLCACRKGRTVEEIFDVRGLRLIVVDEKSCYDALRIVHELWLHIPGQSKDYIVMPKPNG